MDPTRDVVMGHEFCAEIVDFGPSTLRHLKVGQRVCSIPLVFGAAGVMRPSATRTTTRAATAS